MSKNKARSKSKNKASTTKKGSPSSPRVSRTPAKPEVNPQEWDRTVRHTIRVIAQQNSVFTIDDVYEALPEVKNPPKPISSFMREMTDCCESGLNKRYSSRARKMITIWNSKLYRNVVGASVRHAQAQVDAQVVAQDGYVAETPWRPSETWQPGRITTPPYTRPATEPVSDQRRDDTLFLEEFIHFMLDMDVKLATTGESSRFHKPLRELNAEEMDTVIETFLDAEEEKFDETYSEEFGI